MMHPRDIRTRDQWNDYERAAWMQARTERGLPLLAMDYAVLRAMRARDAMAPRISEIIVRLNQILAKKGPAA